MKKVLFFKIHVTYIKRMNNNTILAEEKTADFLFEASGYSLSIIN